MDRIKVAMLDEEMQANGVSARGLAQMAGVTRSTIWKWRRGRLPVPAYALVLVRQAGLLGRLLDRIVLLEGESKIDA